MRLWWSLFLVSAAWNLSAVELDGVRDFVRIQWKTEMPRPVFSVSFRVKVNAADLRVPEGKKEDNSICFEMRSVPFESDGFREFKLFFVSLANPAKSYAGFQATASCRGKTERIRYNAAWRSVGGSVPVDEFVTVVVAFDGMALDAYVNHENLANTHRKQRLSLGESAGEYSLCFGMNKSRRYPLKCEIQDVAVYDKVLSSAEVQSLLNGRSPAEITGTLVYLPLENDLADRLKSPDIRIMVSPGVRKQLSK